MKIADVAAVSFEKNNCFLDTQYKAHRKLCRTSASIHVYGSVLANSRREYPTASGNSQIMYSTPSCQWQEFVGNL
jgi:hypothetical protein